MAPPKILLVNPPIDDFMAYDLWLKPYGMLRIAGYLRGQATLHLFDSLDRSHPLASPNRSDVWGRGVFPSEVLPKLTLQKCLTRTKSILAKESFFLRYLFIFYYIYCVIYFK